MAPAIMLAGLFAVEDRFGGAVALAMSEVEGCYRLLFAEACFADIASLTS